jgi:hypothetical protein
MRKSAYSVIQGFIKMTQDFVIPAQKTVMFAQMKINAISALFCTI